MPRRTVIFRKILLLAVTLVLGLAAAELVLRAVTPQAYYVWRPNLCRIFKPQPGVMPGVSGKSRFQINAAGIRGDAFASHQRYRILCFGGSTTECLILDEEEAWPYRLQILLNAACGEPAVWVGNVGRSGHNTRHHVLQVEKLLSQYRGLDAVMLLVGANDFHQRLSADAGFRPQAEPTPADRHELMRRAFMVFPGRDGPVPIPERFAFWRRLKAGAAWLAPPPAIRAQMQDRAGLCYRSWRRHRAAATQRLDTLPDLSSALAEYAANVNHIIDICRQRRVRPIFVTQPAIWRPGLEPDLQALLWMGGIGNFREGPGHAYYTVEALADGLAVYNRALQDVCARRGCECFDLAAAIPKDGAVFYDDMHFNENGAEQAARALADYLLDREPLKGMRKQ
ncbi:MAG: hypothetical protein JXR37_15075 [Kiritimatiellae bacterium]|nr:hypothetical protein [Kiritimatiellia bacterium]